MSVTDDVVELGKAIRSSGLASTTPDKSRLGAWDPIWGGADGISFFLYLPALVVAVWIAWERRRLDWDRAAGSVTRQVPQCVPRSLTLFAELLVFAFFFRALWFFARATNILGARAAVADVCVVGFDCRERIAESLLDRVGQLVHFAAFSLVVTYWDWWTTTLGGEEGAGGGAEGAEEGGAGSGRVRSRRRCLDGVFLVLDVWLFLIQAVLMPLRFAVPFDQSAIVFMDLGYIWQIAVLYMVVGVLLLTRGAAVHRGIRALIADQRRWLTTVLSSSGGGETFKQRRGPGLHSPLQLQRVLSPRERVSLASGGGGGAGAGAGGAGNAGGGGMDDGVGVFAMRRARAALTDLGENLSPVTNLAMVVVAGGDGDPAAVAEDPSMRLLAQAEWRVAVLAYVCGPLLIVKGVFFVLAPLRVQLADWAEAAAYPWLLYTVPDLLAGVAALALTAPHGAGSGSGAVFGVAARAASHGAEALFALRTCDWDAFGLSLLRAAAALCRLGGCCCGGTPNGAAAGAGAGSDPTQQKGRARRPNRSETLHVISLWFARCCGGCCGAASRAPPEARDQRLTADVLDAVAADTQPRWRPTENTTTNTGDQQDAPPATPPAPTWHLLAPPPPSQQQQAAVAGLVDAQPALVVGDEDVWADALDPPPLLASRAHAPLPWTARGVWI